MGSWVFINNPTGYLEMPPREYNPLKGVIIPESAVTRTHTRGTEGSDTHTIIPTMNLRFQLILSPTNQEQLCCE
jgi:hypothetical protein